MIKIFEPRDFNKAARVKAKKAAAQNKLHNFVSARSTFNKRAVVVCVDCALREGRRPTSAAAPRSLESKHVALITCISIAQMVLFSKVQHRKKMQAARSRER